ncbi:hypothetical protein [Micromonospora sp. NPDC049301]|uniref:hypothetical protein n=1 Tax=Micromonospora sp. NPDC049301 TaxID=3155723 RepID=UPI0034239D54
MPRKSELSSADWYEKPAIAAPAYIGGRLARRAHWVDIWQDPAGAAAVRAIAGGNETVPTVVLGDRAVVNPDRAWLREQLRSS